ncbi:hypothetical protein ERO13_A09G224000v2 [Gossypium hirsutum]|nr:hypothetical protein ERO13_A09G224000v2 [Gossypium hirsutum]
MEQSSMEKYVPLHVCHVNKTSIIINRAHAFLHFIAILFLIHYRLSFFFQHPKNTTIPTLPWLLIFVSELLLSLAWLFTQSYRWRPVTRTVFPERLPADDKLPAIDVFICTADPNKEPSVEVMNTVISAMALAYPPEKLHVYVSDDAGSDVTLRCMKEAWNFARYWVPFCRKYDLVTACPDVYFSSSEVDSGDFEGSEFKAARTKIEEKYEVLKQRIRRIVQQHSTTGDALHNTRDHPSIIEVINEHPKEEDEVKMPLLVYVSREKRPSHHHNFKAGALNVLLRVSTMISNSPYILMLDCDMYCNDPTSTRQAMCYYCDPQTPSSIAFVQFPQTFRNICEDDIYDGEIRNLMKIFWHGFDGVGGPTISGSNFYIKREALLGSFSKQQELMALKRSFGPSNDFIKTLVEDYKPGFIHDGESSRMLLEKANVLASCSYENQTSWGSKVSDSNFNIFFIIFVSAILKSLYEVVTTGGQVRTWRNDWRIWMMRSVTSYFYGSLDVVFNKLGMKEASFLPTNKVIDDEHAKLYEMGIFDFRTATTFLAPLVTVILVNIAAFVRALVVNVVDNDRDGFWEKMFGQMFLSFYILVSNYTVIEGMIIRRDKASIPLYVTLLSGVFSVFILLIGSAILC